MKTNLLIFWALLAAYAATAQNAQNSWRWRNTATNQTVMDMQNASDGGAWVLLSATYPQIVKINPSGQEEYRLVDSTEVYNAPVKASHLELRPDGQGLAFLAQYKNHPTRDSVFLYETDWSGAITNKHFIMTDDSLVFTSMDADEFGGYLINGLTGAGATAVRQLLFRFNRNNTNLVNIPTNGYRISNKNAVYTANNEIFYTANKIDSFCYLIFDTLGVKQWDTSVYFVPNNFTIYPRASKGTNGELLVFYQTGKMTRLDSNRQILPEINFFALGMQGTTTATQGFDGNYLVVDTVFSVWPGFCRVSKISSVDNSVMGATTFIGMYNPTGLDGYSLGQISYLAPTTDGGVAVLMIDGVLKINSNGDFYYNNIYGDVLHDTDLSCDSTLGDSLLRQRLVRAEEISTGDVYYNITDNEGKYRINVPAGTYEVSSNHSWLPYNNFWTTCNNTQTIAFNNTAAANKDTVDILRQTTYNCPLLEVGHNVYGLLSCASSEYGLWVYNHGTVAEPNASITFTLDPSQRYLGHSGGFNITNLGNNQYKFDVGNVPPYQWVGLAVTVTTDCSVPNGAFLCTETSVYPDTFCGFNFTGPNILITDSCLGADSLIFSLTNIGANMVSPQNYSIIEDNLMYRPLTPFLLNNGQKLDIPINRKDSSDYIILVEQAVSYPSIQPNLPTSLLATDCNPNAIFSNPAQFFINNSNTTHYDCTESRIPIPCPHQAQPRGYGSNNLINNGTPIIYQTGFSNPVRAPFNKVVILDTLDSNLDITTFRMQGVSHKFVVDMLPNRIVRFTADSINLVDSSVSVLASRGYISYEIMPLPNLPLGTRIEHRSGVSIDNRPPLVTGTVFHTIGSDFIPMRIVSISETQNNTTVTAFPNPFAEELTFSVGTAQDELSIQITDITGQQIAVKFTQTNPQTLQLQRGNLPSGVYFFQLQSKGQLLATGKIIAQ